MFPGAIQHEETLKDMHFISHVICGSCKHFSEERFCKIRNIETDKWWYCPLFERK